MRSNGNGSGTTSAWSKLMGLTGHGLRSPRDFRGVLERERSLSDRNKHQFSLLVLYYAQEEYKPSDARRVGKALATRLRKTDVVGWIDSRRIGVLMPHTNPGGAWKVGNEIAAALASKSVELKVEVYVYPSADASPNGNGNHGAHQLLLFPMHLEMPEPAEDFVPPAATPFAALTMETCRGFFEGPGIPLWKRGLDIVFALVGMLLVSPLILLSTIAVKMLSPGPAFFGQERVGLMGKRFKCWKIRTMHADIDHEIHRQYFHNLMCHDVPMHKLDQRQDPRLIPLIGRFLRASAIDELPQLVNVLRGEMSLVGPRPCLPYEYEEYLQWQKQRVEAVPGLTGLWQVSGKNRTTFTQMMRLDISYSRRKSLWTDSRILIRTLPAVWNEIRRALGPRQQR